MRTAPSVDISSDSQNNATSASQLGKDSHDVPLSCRRANHVAGVCTAGKLPRCKDGCARRNSVTDAPTLLA
jgi:hypothetical protein